MIVGMSISVRLATGFGGLTPSHSLAPVTIPQIGSLHNMSTLIDLHLKPVQAYNSFGV